MNRTNNQNKAIGASKSTQQLGTAGRKPPVRVGMQPARAIGKTNINPYVVEIDGGHKKDNYFVIFYPKSGTDMTRRFKTEGKAQSFLDKKLKPQIKTDSKLKKFRDANYVFYHDAGHGWLRVPLSTLKKLGIEDKISSYSYMDNTYAYLEEDSDYGIFMNALKFQTVDDRHTFAHGVQSKYSDNSHVRGKESYSKPIDEKPMSTLKYRLEPDGKFHVDIDQTGNFGLQFDSKTEMRNAFVEEIELKRVAPLTNPEKPTHIFKKKSKESDIEKDIRDEFKFSMTSEPSVGKQGMGIDEIEKEYLEKVDKGIFDEEDRLIIKKVAADLRKEESGVFKAKKAIGKRIRLDDPINWDGEVTSIEELDEKGKIEFREIKNFQGRSGKKTTKYFADIKGSDGMGWEIGKMAYLSRTGKDVESEFTKPRKKAKPNLNKYVKPVGKATPKRAAGQAKAPLGRDSPLGRAIESARQYRITLDKKYLTEIRKTLSFLSPDELEKWIVGHTTEFGKRKS